MGLKIKNTKRTKKKRKNTKKYYDRRVKLLKKKCWNAMSLYVRKRDNYTCFTCGATKGRMNAGHFIHGKLDYDEININCQCSHCNLYLSGNGAVYAIKLIKKYGQEVVDDLFERAKKPQKYDEQQLIKIYNDIQSKLINLINKQDPSQVLL